MAEIKLEVSTTTENQNEVQAIAVLLNSLAGNDTVKTSNPVPVKETKADTESEANEVKETAAEKRKRIATEKKAAEDAAKTESDNNENAIADAVEGTETTEEENEVQDDKVDYGKLRDQAKELLTKKATIDGVKDKVRAKLAELNSKGISGLKDDQVQTFIDFLNTL